MQATATVLALLRAAAAVARLAAGVHRHAAGAARRGPVPLAAGAACGAARRSDGARLRPDLRRVQRGRGAPRCACWPSMDAARAIWISTAIAVVAGLLLALAESRIRLREPQVDVVRRAGWGGLGSGRGGRPRARRFAVAADLGRDQRRVALAEQPGRGVRRRRRHRRRIAAHRRRSAPALRLLARRGRRLPREPGVRDGRGRLRVPLRGRPALRQALQVSAHSDAAGAGGHRDRRPRDLRGLRVRARGSAARRLAQGGADGSRVAAPVSASPSTSSSTASSTGSRRIRCWPGPRSRSPSPPPPSAPAPRRPALRSAWAAPCRPPGLPSSCSSLRCWSRRGWRSAGPTAPWKTWRAAPAAAYRDLERAADANAAVDHAAALRGRDRGRARRGQARRALLRPACSTREDHWLAHYESAGLAGSRGDEGDRAPRARPSSAPQRA